MADRQEADIKELIKEFNNISEAIKDLYSYSVAECDRSKGDLPANSTMSLRIPNEYEEMFREIFKNLSTYEIEVDQIVQDIDFLMRMCY